MVCSVASSLPAAGMPTLAEKWADGNARFRGTALSQAPRTSYRTREPPPPPYTHTAASRGDELKCSHWSLEVQPLPHLSDHTSDSGKWWPTNLFLSHVTVLFSGALGRTTEASGFQATKAFTPAVSRGVTGPHPMRWLCA